MSPISVSPISVSAPLHVCDPDLLLHNARCTTPGQLSKMRRSKSPEGIGEALLIGWTVRELFPNVRKTLV